MPKASSTRSGSLLCILFFLAFALPLQAQVWLDWDNVTGSNLTLDALRDFAQHGVAGCVTPGIVDLFEVIDVQHQANHTMLVAPCT